MKLKKLGNSDLYVSPYCLGTMTYGEQTTEADAHLQIDKALGCGINFLDTAEMYPTSPLRKETAGNTEKIIGNWIKKNSSIRDKIIIGTKIIGSGFDNIRDGGPINPKSIKIALENSLKNLKTDYVDLYQLHWPNRGSYHFRKNWEYDPSDQNSKLIREDIHNVLGALSQIKKEGKIRAIGLSNETCWGVMEFIKASKSYDNIVIASIQNEYSLLCRLYDTDMSELSHNESIPLLAYSPLAAGLLTGKYLDSLVPENSRLTRVSKLGGRINEKSTLAVRAYLNLAKNYNIDPVHMSLSFCNQRPFMGSIIFGATTALQLRTILKGLDVILTDEILNEINEINKKYPLCF